MSKLIALLVVIGLAVFSIAAKPSPPTFFITHGYEPISPGRNFPISGCGYQANLPVHVIDSVVYDREYTVGGFDLPFDNLPIGKLEQLEFTMLVNNNGCILPNTYGYEGWGIGRHLMKVYQTTTRRGPKILTEAYFDEYVHNKGEVRSVSACYYYAKTPVGPLNHYTCPDTDGDNWSDYVENYFGTDPLVGCSFSPIQNDESGIDPWPLDFNDDQLSNIDDGAGFSKFTSNPTYMSDPKFDRRFDLNMNGEIGTALIWGWEDNSDLLIATSSNSSCEWLN